ncbi:hypothetical protein [Nocardioides sp. SYSU DS0651]|uniref:hypothetical protein n=1 Tax=Nocardioides sp. SYSU DS0651 TaxID=3415955 RepID=UPI003F4B14FF
MSSYDEIWSTIEKIVDAAIEAEMARNHFFRVGDDYQIAHRESDVGDGWSGGTVNGPGSGQVRWIVQPDRFLVAWPDQHLELVASIYDKWQTAVPEVFRGWTWLPDPAAMVDDVNRVIQAAQRISQGEDLEDGPRIPAHPTLPGNLAEANGILENFEGGTVSAFRVNYTRRLTGTVLPNQCGLICEIAEGMLAEAAIFNEARSSVVSIADSMLAAMKAAKPSAEESGSTDALLTVLGIGLSFAGIFATGGVATAIGLASTTLSTVTAFQGSEKSVSLAADHPDAVLDAAREALTTLNDDITSEETAVQATFRGVADALDGPIGRYDLRAPRDLTGSTSHQELVGSPTLLDVDTERLRKVAHTFLPPIADLLDAAAVRLDPWPALWTRSYDIGVDSDGPHTERVAASQALASVLVGTAAELRNACDHLLIAAGDFDRTEGGVEAALRHHAEEVREQPLPDVPFEPPPSPWAGKPLVPYF